MLRLTNIAYINDNEAHGDDDYTIIDDDGIIGVYDGVSGSTTKYKGHEAKTHFEQQYDRSGCVRKSIEQIISQQRYSSTLTMMQLRRNHQIHIFNIGDSRAFLIRKNEIHQVSRDDTLEEAIKHDLPEELKGKKTFTQLRQGIIKIGPERLKEQHHPLIRTILHNLLPGGETELFTLENLGRILSRFRQLHNAHQFKNDQKRNFNPSLLALILFNAAQILTQSLKNADPDKKSRPQVTIGDPYPQDKILVCTDGFYENLSEQTVLTEIVTQHSHNALEALVHLAKTEGRKSDDITAILATLSEVKSNTIEEEQPTPIFVY